MCHRIPELCVAAAAALVEVDTPPPKLKPEVGCPEVFEVEAGVEPNDGATGLVVVNEKPPPPKPGAGRYYCLFTING